MARGVGCCYHPLPGMWFPGRVSPHARGRIEKTFSRPMTGRASFKDGDPELDLEATHHLVAGSPENPATT
jgi:hypothetical protein